MIPSRSMTRNQQERRPSSASTASSTSTSSSNTSNKKAMYVLSSLAMVAICSIGQIHSSSRSLSSISRRLCANGESTPYVDIDIGDIDTSTPVAAAQAATLISERLLSQMDSPRIPGRRNPPSHIALCTEFLHRRELHEANPDNKFTTHFHVEEDDAVCRDWSTPMAAIMQMLSAEIVGYFGQKYGISYLHNCRKDKAPDETTDGLDYTTVQEAWPDSGLILDNGVIEEDYVADLCKGCIHGFNIEMESNTVDPDDPNPPWFHPHQTHHCILYPNSARPLVNDQHELDLVAVTEQRALAQESPFSKILETLIDRLGFMALTVKMDKGDPPIATMAPTGGMAQVAKRFLFGNANENRNLAHKARVLAEVPVPFGTNVEEQNGAVIYLDDGSVPISMQSYAKYIPSSVSTIDVLFSPLCSTVYLSNEELCVKHAADIFNYMTNMYPGSVVNSHMVASTAAAYSRMILAKFLVCPPGTSACLMPALAKDTDTFAVVAESPQDLGTYQYFDFVGNYDDHLQIAHVDNVLLPVSSTAADGNSNPEDAVEGTGKTTTTEGDSLVDPFGSARAGFTTTDTRTDTTSTGMNFDAFLGGEHRDGCIELRGKLGSWELQYAYEDLGQEDVAAHLRGQSNVDVAEERFSTMEAQSDSDPSVEARFGAWNEDVNPDCALDMLNLNGLCEVVTIMGLGVIQFVGDQYTEEQVKSFWALLGLDDPDDPNDSGAVFVDGQSLPQYRKTAHCPREGVAFDIVFTPNEYLVQTVEVEGPIVIHNPETRYIPVPAPTPGDSGGTVTNNYFYDNSQTTTSTDTTSSYDSRADVQTRTDTAAQTSNWANQPYGGTGGYGGYGGGGYGGGGYGGNGGMGMMGMGMMMMPVFSAGCCCVPFQNQYNQYAGGGVVPTGKALTNTGGVPAAGQRQVVVAGQTPNTDLETYIQGIDEFNRGITDYASENDVVILRTGFETNTQVASTGGRRAKETVKKMTTHELNKANRYIIKSVDEYRRRTKQMDMVGNDPARSGLPSIHVLDISHMTNTHPHAKHVAHGRRNEQVASLYDHWNHLLYSNLRDIAAAERKRKTQMQHWVESAPKGSPYHNGVEIFPGHF